MRLSGLYVILDPAIPGSHSLTDIVYAALDAGVRLFQLRVKTAEARTFYDLAAGLCPVIHKRGGIFMVNDRVDIANAIGADGVHLGQDDLPLADARAILGSGKLIGISTHNPAQAIEAEAGGADYIGCGPVFPTATKEHPDPVVGLEGLRQARARVRLPIVAIGGITARNAGDVRAAGADGLAVVSAVLAAPDPYAACAELMKEGSVRNRT